MNVDASNMRPSSLPLPPREGRQSHRLHPQAVSLQKSFGHISNSPLLTADVFMVSKHQTLIQETMAGQVSMT